MKLRDGLWTFGFASLLALGCASGKADQVSDLQLARLSADQLGPVNEARMEQQRANDDANRQELAVRRAENEIRNAKDENHITDARYDQAENSIKSAQYVDDPSQRHEQEHQLEILRAYKDVTEQKIRVSEAQFYLAVAEKDAAVARKEHADARLEWEKYNVLVAANDPVAQSIDGVELKRRYDRTGEKVRDRERDLKTPHERLVQSSSSSRRSRRLAEDGRALTSRARARAQARWPSGDRGPGQHESLRQDKP